MKQVLVKRELNINPMVKIMIKGRNVLISGVNIKTGEESTLKRNFNHSNCKFNLINLSKGKKLVVCKMNVTNKNAAVVRSVITIISKMITGVLIGFRYKMRLVYAHFPINISISENKKEIEIRNFLGEKIVRKCNMIDTTLVKLGELKDEIYVEGNDLDDVSQSAARIHLSCMVRKKDIRKFLDGIYVWAKGPKDEEIPIQ